MTFLGLTSLEWDTVSPPSVPLSGVQMKDKSVGWYTGCEGKEENTIFLDYDDESLESVKRDIKKLQENFRLGNATISKSSARSYHVFFFNDIVEWETLKAIVKESESDMEFKEFKDRAGFSRVRIGEKGKKGKPKVIETVESDYNDSGPRGKFKKMAYKKMISG